MLRLIRTLAMFAAVLFGVASDALAQGFGGRGGSAFSGGTGGFGGNQMGGFGGMSSGFGGMSSGLGGMGGSRMGGMSGFGGSGFGGMSGFGGSSFGGAGAGGSGFGGMSGFGGNQGFGGGMGGGNMGGQSFVGRDSGDMNAVMSQMGRAGTQFFNNMNRNMGRNNRNRQQQEETGENAPPTIRIRLEVGFPHSPPAPSRLATNIQSRLERLAVDHNLGRPQVAVQGDTVVLRGVAESESQRLVLEKLIGMEPGVRAVRNEMTVGATP